MKGVFIMKSKVFYLLMVISIIMASGIWFFTCRPNPSETRLSARVGTWKTAQTIQPFLYDKFLAKEFNCEILTFTNPGDQKTALLAKSLDFCGTTLVHAIVSASKGEPIVVVANLCEKCSALVVKSGTGIKNVQDLKGKTIGYVPSTMHDILLRETLTKSGLDPLKDVTLMRVDFFDMAAALAKGSIDAFCSGEPYPSIVKQNGSGEILTYPYYGDSIGTINGAMITTREMIEKQPRLIEEIVRAHAHATEYLIKNHREWLDMASAFGADRNVLEEASKNMILAWDMDDKYIKSTKSLALRMKDLGIIEKEPDWDTFFDLRFVEKARKSVGR